MQLENQIHELHKSENVRAFLKLIRYAEHRREDDEVYFYMLGGKLKSYDTSRHPIQRFHARANCPDMAGAYHHRLKTWEEAYRSGIVSDFSPASQDLLAIRKMVSNSALQYVEAGDIESAITRLNGIWTALPGTNNARIDMAEARTRFNRYLHEFGRHRRKQQRPFSN